MGTKRRQIFAKRNPFGLARKEKTGFIERGKRSRGTVIELAKMFVNVINWKMLKRSPKRGEENSEKGKGFSEKPISRLLRMRRGGKNHKRGGNNRGGEKARGKQL